MNIIVSPIRSTLTPNHVFIHCVGPPLDNFDPLPFVKSWLKRGKRSSVETNCLKRTTKKNQESCTVSQSYNSIWNCINT